MANSTMQEENLMLQEELGDIPCRPSQKEIIVELGVFLFLIVPSMVLSYFARGQERINFVLLAVSTIFRDGALVSLILFLAWRDKEPLRRLGLTSRGLDREIFLGAVLYLPFVLVVGVIVQVLNAIGLSRAAEPIASFFGVGGGWQVALAVVLVVVVAISEEIIFRGYLINRLQTATRSTTIAVLLSVVVFALGHGYEGSLGVVAVGVMGLLLSLVYLWRQSLVAPIVLHFIQNFLALVIAPFLK